MKRFLQTFSKLSVIQDFDQPLNDKAIGKHIGKMNQMRFEQPAIATTAGTELGMVDFAGLIGDAYFIITGAAAAAETYTIDLQKAPVAGGGFASVLTAPYVISNANQPTNDQQSLAGMGLIAPLSKSFNPGDRFRVVTTLVSGSTLVSFLFVLEPTIRPYITNS
jgi:hypothetical protein